MNSQNESPFGNPRFVVAIITVFIFLWGWQYYVNKNFPQPATKPATEKVDSAAAQEPQQKTQEQALKIDAPASKTTELAAVEKTEDTYSYEDNNVKWTISSYGMGLSSFELKTYLDKNKKPILYAFDEKLFALHADKQMTIFNLNKINDTTFYGTTTVNGKNIKRTITYNKETMSFDSKLEFEVAPATVTFSTVDVKHTPQSSNFLVPSFEVQNFLYKDAEKVKTEDIAHLKESDSLNKGAVNVALASIGTQYFTQSYLDKSEILPSINMAVIGNTAKLNVSYDLQNSKISKIQNIIYIGPKSSELLKKIDPLLPEVLDLGMFGFIAKPLLVLMKFMHGLFGNWGLAIIALTLVMRFLMLPFNVVSFKSARAMQKIQPQLTAIREKYKNDPMAVNRETMALMKEHNANPLSSCLPMLIQIPIFFALWRTIGSSIEIYQQPFFGWITDLSSHDKFFVLPVLMGVTMYLQQKMTPTTMDPTQAKILNFMPVLFSLFMVSLPSGLTLYNFISSLFGVTQQYFLLKDNKKKQLS